MNEFTNRRQLLEEKIADMESTLQELKAQLKREAEQEQHMAIEKLEVFLGDIDSKNRNLQDFWRILCEEISDLFSGSTRDDKEK